MQGKSQPAPTVTNAALGAHSCKCELEAPEFVQSRPNPKGKAAMPPCSDPAQSAEKPVGNGRSASDQFLVQTSCGGKSPGSCRQPPPSQKCVACSDRRGRPKTPWETVVAHQISSWCKPPVEANHQACVDSPRL